MFVHDVQWYPYHLPFSRDFTTAHGAERVREGAIVEVHTTDSTVGVGEIAPLTAFGGGTLGESLAELPALITHGRGLCLTDALSLVTACALECTDKTFHAASLCGLETALLDAFSKAGGMSVSQLLAPPSYLPRREVLVNTVITASDIDAAWIAAHKAVDDGFDCVKLKVAMQQTVEREVERIVAVREAIGAHRQLRIDANGGWTFEQVRTIISRCAEFDIQYVEQPLPAHDLSGMRRLREVVPVPIAADEAVSDPDSARRILAHGAADVLVLKPQCVGGLRACQRIIHEATKYGVRCVITTAVESGVGVGATLHLAAATPDITLECGIATLDLLADDLITPTLKISNGRMFVPEGPGLGVTLDRDALARFSPDSGGRY
ncbi:MAG: o-succinylbenzoate synthase [Ktedonobacterales bacterium]